MPPIKNNLKNILWFRKQLCDSASSKPLLEEKNESSFIWTKCISETLFLIPQNSETPGIESKHLSLLILWKQVWGGGEITHLTLAEGEFQEHSPAASRTWIRLPWCLPCTGTGDFQQDGCSVIHLILSSEEHTSKSGIVSLPHSKTFQWSSYCLPN